DPALLAGTPAAKALNGWACVRRSPEGTASCAAGVSWQTMKNVAAPPGGPGAMFCVVALLLLSNLPGAAVASFFGGHQGTSPSRVLEQTFWSQALGRKMPYAVYLPPGYGTSPQKRYPVLYMLHGMGGDHQEWAHRGLFAHATRLIDKG